MKRPLARRAMTMVELLLALAMLSGLTVACVSWTTATARASVVEGGGLSWGSGVDRSLEYLDRALLVEDATPRGREAWRLRIGLSEVTVRTREVVEEPGREAAVCKWVRLRVEGGVLLAEALDAGGAVASRRPLLGGVSSLDASSERLDETTVAVLVRIARVGGGSAERRWRLARESVQ